MDPAINPAGTSDADREIRDVTHEYDWWATPEGGPGRLPEPMTSSTWLALAVVGAVVGVILGHAAGWW